MNIDIEELRNDLIDYYGTAAVNVFAPVFLEVARVEKASSEELIRMANNIGLDLKNTYAEQCPLWKQTIAGYKAYR